MFFLDKLTKINKLNSIKINKEKLPLHIAIIPDGNGRWASNRGIPRNMGHRQGSETLKQIVLHCADLGIKYLTVYAFSTENWKRPESEVNALMSLLKEFLDNYEQELSGKDIQIRIIGNINVLSEELINKISKVVELTKNKGGMILNIALNYGGRDEIVNAVRKIAQEVINEKIKIEDINERLFSSKLYTAGIPDPDLIIRTGGEKRISNFLLWQAAYTELWYSDVLWPDFTKKHLLEAIHNFQNRKRRFGGI